ncbi:MAG: hypothetical protein D0531_11985 [Methylococcales bacterium]|nr:MAG: hypothetical protein D0531_11985 [Methylococcales bacterium]
MNYKTYFIKKAIKWTPKMMVVWTTNKILKGIAHLNDFELDVDARKVYVNIKLEGEAESIEVWMNDFAIASNENEYQLLIQDAQSNRIWLTNIFSHITGRAWNIPVPPKFASYFKLIADLFQPAPIAIEHQSS